MVSTGSAALVIIALSGSGPARTLVTLFTATMAATTAITEAMLSLMAPTPGSASCRCGELRWGGYYRCQPDAVRDLDHEARQRLAIDHRPPFASQGILPALRPVRPNLSVCGSRA